VLVGTSWGTHWELEEYSGNLMGILWKLDEKPLGTGGAGQKKRNLSPHPPQNPKGKN